MLSFLFQNQLILTKELFLNTRTHFIEKLVAERGKNLTPTLKMKLLNINAYAKHIYANYSGSTLLPDGTVYSIPFAYSKTKQILVNGLLDTLKGLFTSQSYIRTMHDTKMGFILGRAYLLKLSLYILYNSVIVTINTFIFQTLNVF